MSGARAVATGAGVALAMALPAALAAQVLDVVRDGDGVSPATYALALVVLLGMAAGGFVVGHQGGSVRAAAASGAVAIALVQTLGVVRQAVADEEVTWVGIPLTVALAIALAVVGGTMGRRRAARTRP